MVLNFSEKILSHKSGDLTGDGVDEDIYLVTCLDNKCEYRTYVLIEEKNNMKTYKIDLEEGSYKVDLSLENFVFNNKKEIVIRNLISYNGGYTRSRIFTLQEGEIIEIFNSDVFFENNKVIGEYKDYYKVEILNLKINKKYIVDISRNFKYYLDFVYNKEGKVKSSKERVNISRVYNSYVFYELGSNIANLKIYQKILGKSDSDYIGDIESEIKWEKGDFQLIGQRVILEGNLINEEEIKLESKRSYNVNDLVKVCKDWEKEKSYSSIYWYYLAESQLAEENFEEALKSINMGFTFKFNYYFLEKALLLKEKIERNLKRKI